MNARYCPTGTHGVRRIGARSRFGRANAHDGAATPPALATICCFSSALATTFVTSSTAERIVFGSTVLLSPDHTSLLSASEKAFVSTRTIVSVLKYPGLYAPGHAIPQ